MTSAESLKTADTPQAPGVPSPCINVCRINAQTQWCDGCLRTIDEIRAWSKLDDGAKRAIWVQIDGRHASLASQPRETAP